MKQHPIIYTFSLIHNNTNNNFHYIDNVYNFKIIYGENLSLYLCKLCKLKNIDTPIYWFYPYLNKITYIEKIDILNFGDLCKNCQ